MGDVLARPAQGLGRARGTTTRGSCSTCTRRDLPGEATMCRYADDDEVDLVIVGAGAGGSVLAQRLARRGWRVVILEAGPFWHPDEDWVSDEAGSHELYWTQKRIIGGADPIELGQEQLRARGRRLDGALRRLHPAVPPERLLHLHRRRGRRRLADRLPGPAPALRAGGARTAGRRAGLAVGTSAPLPVLPAPGLRGRREAARGRAGAAASRCGSARSASSTAPSATARTASTAATACRAARSTPRPARTSPTCPTRSPTAWRSAPTAWPCRSRSTTTPAGPAAWSTPSEADGAHRLQRARPSRSPATRSRRRGCC